MSSRIAAIAGLKRVHIASMANVPRARAASMIRCVSSTVELNDFSTSRALPASMTASAMSVCCVCGVAM